MTQGHEFDRYFPDGISDSFTSVWRRIEFAF